MLLACPDLVEGRLRLRAPFFCKGEGVMSSAFSMQGGSFNPNNQQ